MRQRGVIGDKQYSPGSCPSIALTNAAPPRYGSPVIHCFQGLRLRLQAVSPWLPLAALLLGAALASAAAPNIKEYEVTGTSRGKDGKPAAEKPAEDDALKNAVQKGIDELVPAKIPDDKAGEVKKILGKARRYIPEFRVGDRSEAGTTVILKVKVKVNLDALKADLTTAGIIASDEKPAVLTRVIILAAPAKGGPPPWWAEGGAANVPDPLTYVLVDALRAKGFDVIEPRRPEPDPDAKVAPTPGAPPDMGNDNLLAVARSRDVDVAVKVTWEVQIASRSLDGITYALARAKVGPVEAIAAKDGRIVATVTAEGVAGEPLSTSQASLGKVPVEIAERVGGEATRRAAADAAARLSAALGDPTAKGSATATVKLVVAGLDTWVTYDRFERVLQRDVKSVRTATLHAIERGEATFDVSLERGVSVEGLADELTKKDFEQFSVKVTEKTADRIILHLSR